MLENLADERKTPFNMTDFRQAVENGNLDDFNEKCPLCEEDATRRDFRGENVVTLLIKNDLLDEYTDILEKKGEKLSREVLIDNDQDSINAFRRIASKGNLMPLQRILEKNDDSITKQDLLQKTFREQGKPMIHWVAEGKCLKQATDILAKNNEPLTKNDFSLKDNQGKSAIRAVAENGQLLDAVEAVKAGGEKYTKADLQAADGKESIFKSAVYSGYLNQVADILADNGEILTKEELLAADDKNRNLLHWGAKNKGGLTKALSITEDGYKPEKAELLKKDDDGRNVLSWGAENGTLDEVVKSMGKGEKISKADFLTEDNSGMTIYHTAMSNANIKQLADVEKKNGGKTTLDDVMNKIGSLEESKRHEILYDDSGAKLKDMSEAGLFNMKALNEYWKTTPEKFKTTKSSLVFRKCQRLLREQLTESLNPALIKKTNTR